MAARAGGRWGLGFGERANRIGSSVTYNTSLALGNRVDEAAAAGAFRLGLGAQHALARRPESKARRRKGKRFPIRAAPRGITPQR